MEKIPSFQKNHDTLPVGLHAQTDENGITTFDLRFKKPNGATVLRNSREKENIVYFGPMGCRTGFYLLTRNLSCDRVKELLKGAVAVAVSLDEIPGSSREECGNYLEHDLAEAKRELKEYLTVLVNL